MRYQVARSEIQVIGKIWMPNVDAAAVVPMSRYDVDNARDEDGNLTRESVERWVLTHSGDFSSVEDFRGDISDGAENFVSEWADSDSEARFMDAMCSEEE